MWIKVRLILLVSAALLTKTEAIDFLLVLSLNCTNRRFPTLPLRHFKHSHDSNHRRKSNSLNVHVLKCDRQQYWVLSTNVNLVRIKPVAGFPHILPMSFQNFFTTFYPNSMTLFSVVV